MLVQFTAGSTPGKLALPFVCAYSSTRADLPSQQSGNLCSSLPRSTVGLVQRSASSPTLQHDGLASHCSYSGTCCRLPDIGRLKEEPSDYTECDFVCYACHYRMCGTSFSWVPLCGYTGMSVRLLRQQTFDEHFRFSQHKLRRECYQSFLGAATLSLARSATTVRVVLFNRFVTC